MLIECGKCKFKDKPENFTAIKILTLINNQPVEHLYIVCPVCENLELFQSFLVPPQVGISRLLIPDKEITDPNKAMKYLQEKIKELKSKYLPDYEK